MEKSNMTFYEQHQSKNGAAKMLHILERKERKEKKEKREKKKNYNVTAEKRQKTALLFLIPRKNQILITLHGCDVRTFENKTVKPSQPTPNELSHNESKVAREGSRRKRDMEKRLCLGQGLVKDGRASGGGWFGVGMELIEVVKVVLGFASRGLIQVGHRCTAVLLACLVRL